MKSKNNQPSEAVGAFNQFWAVSHAVAKETDTYLKKAAGLSSGKYTILMVLHFSGGTMPSAKLAARTGTRPHNITALVKRLKEDGLVSTERGTSDTRFNFVSITDRGKALMEKTLPGAREHAEKVLASFDGEALGELCRMMGVIEKNVTK
jgi:DNA-binding MarR family transcriptional regulator